VKEFKIKSFCKINLSLRVLSRLNSGYHNINSIITFCNLHDVISIYKINGSKDKINFSGRFKKGINEKSNTVAKVLHLLRKKNFLKKQAFKINIQKNIPHGSGLGGGSSNAADLLNFFNKNMYLKLNNNELNKMANQIGFDVPISLEKKNTFLIGRKGEMRRINKKFALNLLILYPNLICPTKKIYKKHIIENNFKPYSWIIAKDIEYYNFKTKKKLINYLIYENNDLEKTVTKLYPNIKRIINFIKSQDGCHFSRISGSGSSCIGIFSSMKNAIKAQKLVKLKYPKFWCVVSKTI
jgi:4-diphosphocytidyl-2-C-methyl-D-erythritol kinase